MIDTKKIESKIDSMDALCEKGRNQVKELVKELFPDAKWEIDVRLAAGQVWSYMGDPRIIVDIGDHKYMSIDLDGSRRNTPVESINDLSCVKSGKFLANSLEEYFELKRKGQLPK